MPSGSAGAGDGRLWKCDPHIMKELEREGCGDGKKTKMNQLKIELTDTAWMAGNNNLFVLTQKIMLKRP